MSTNDAVRFSLIVYSNSSIGMSLLIWFSGEKIPSTRTKRSHKMSGILLPYPALDTKMSTGLSCSVLISSHNLTQASVDERST